LKMRTAISGIWILCFVIVSSHLLSMRVAAQPNELVVNGGFETGDFNGWSADNNCAVIYIQASTDLTAHDSRSKYSTRVGTARMAGTLAQTVRIPAKCAATLSFWCIVGQGCTLDGKVTRKKDGAVIASWSLAGAAWKSKKQELDVSLANEEVTIEFTGTGYVEEKVVRMFDPFSKMWFYQTYREYKYAYVDDVSLVPRVAAYEATVRIGGLPENVLAKILVDGREREKIPGGQTGVYAFPLGESHEIEVEQYVDGGIGVRYYCESNQILFSSDKTHIFYYKKQYLLKIESDLGTCKGEGWYGAGENVTISANPSSIPLSGILGSLGGRYVFDRWSGDLSSQSAEATVYMDGPKTIKAQWKEDYAMLTAVVGALVAAGGGGAFLSIRRARKGKRIGVKSFKIGPTKEEAKPKGEPTVPAPEKQVKEVDKAEIEQRLKKLDELMAQGKIGKSVFDRLRKELSARAGEEEN